MPVDYLRIGDEQLHVGLEVENWETHPKARPGKYRWRGHNPIKYIVFHTVWGAKNKRFVPPRDAGYDLLHAKNIRNAGRMGVQLWYDLDSSMVQTSDLKKWYTEHCHSTRLARTSVGSEDGETRDGQTSEQMMIDSTMVGAKILVQQGRQVYGHGPFKGAVKRIYLAMDEGFVNHCDATMKGQRGIDDAGEMKREVWEACGVPIFNYAKMEHRKHWAQVQEDMLDLYGGKIDGIPGPATREALHYAGWRDGIMYNGHYAEMPDRSAPVPW